MPLFTTPKERSASSNQVSAVPQRQQVAVGKQTASTARAEALKARLTGKAPTEPVTPRPTGSSARRDALSKLNKFPSAQAQQAPAPSQPPRGASQTSARALPSDLSAIEPPPSGLSEGSESIRPDTSAAEPTTDHAEATSDPMSPQLAALARQERQIRKARQELKAAQDAWKQDQAKYISRDALTSDPLKVLAAAGITADKLVELQINQAPTDSQDPQQVLLGEINALKQQIKDLVDPENGTLAKRDQEAYTQAVEQIRQDAKLLVDSNPDYGTIKSEGKAEEVVELVTRVFNEEGIVLDVEEAARLVEEKLVDRLTKQYERISKLDKFKTKFGQAPEVPEATDAQPSQDAPSVPRTLTNSVGSTRPLSSKERAIQKVQAAIEARKRNQ